VSEFLVFSFMVGFFPRFVGLLVDWSVDEDYSSKAISSSSRLQADHCPAVLLRLVVERLRERATFVSGNP